jgi:hypothetical protein
MSGNAGVKPDGNGETAPLVRVLSSKPHDYVGTVMYQLECGHSTVRKASVAVPIKARCSWCRLLILGGWIRIRPKAPK